MHNRRRMNHATTSTARGGRFEEQFTKTSTVQTIEGITMRVRRRTRNVPVVLLAMVLTSFFHAGHSVWSVNIPHQAYIISVQPGLCMNLGGLTREQIDLCQKNIDHMASVGLGAKMAIQECQFQYQYEKWNCSIPDAEKSSLFERITSKDVATREAALTYAISSAGVVWALARACTEGNLSTCSCSRERRPLDLNKEYQWGGCGDNIEYAVKFGREFMEAGEDHRPTEEDRKKYARTLMNLHNNNLGRRVVKDISVVECKCHGVCGSCNLKTCWRQLVEFREIGNALHDKYDAAVQVALKRKEGRSLLLPMRSRHYSQRKAKSAQETRDELVYIDKSPDFCSKNAAHGAQGTRGRKCIKESLGKDGCNLLCCSRGYKMKKEVQATRCRCKFHWCCKVKCKTCIKNVTTHICN
ncbi:protein Wnt-5a isoform X2 [Nematostella vectensis]|uniref:protein Wnt-5a isoform X2 n=1 Tax=Nematostella vectensis TaxID=45351 RepID=UPI002077423B|nr:protein Wnt-5a isoform X2 [Nematostella vectensis]